MHDAILKKMDEGFATLVMQIKALEEKEISDGLMMKPANLQPLASYGVAKNLTTLQLADTLTTSGAAREEFEIVLATVSFIVTTSADSTVVCYRGIDFDKALCTTDTSGGGICRCHHNNVNREYLARPSHPKYHGR
jgi:hypothetical protein